MNNNNHEPQKNPVVETEQETIQEKEYRLAIEEGREPPEFRISGGGTTMERYRDGEEDREAIAMMEGRHCGFNGIYTRSLLGDS